MNLPELSIKRPIFVTCIFLLILSLGIISFTKLGLDMLPKITFPVVIAIVNYPGAGPIEVENLVSKPLEDAVSTVSGLDSIRSISRDGTGLVVVQFNMETDIKWAQQQVRDRISGIRAKLPEDIQEPIIRTFDVSDFPIMTIAVDSEMSPGKLYDMIETVIKPKLEQVNQVGMVEIIGGTKREIHVELDRTKLKSYELSSSMVAAKLKASGNNIPAGILPQENKDLGFRTIAEYKSLKDIGKTVVSFLGNDVPVTINSIGKVVDTLESETSRAYVNGKPAVFLRAYRQSDANTVAVVDDLTKRINELNKEMETLQDKVHIEVVSDMAWPIRLNVDDVKQSIIIGLVLTVFVVFLFLGSFRSTFITSIALPDSLLGAFILMLAAGFSINVLTLLSLSLAVGLLIDDAIVVRENIFRHMEMGKSPAKAALEGANEVLLPVVATTLTIIAVFSPIALLGGIMGQFLKQFGLTICFAMMISLFDALTMAPMLSAYLGGIKEKHKHSPSESILKSPLWAFERFQKWLSEFYGRVLVSTLKHPLKVLFVSLVIFTLSIISIKWIPKTFSKTPETGEFTVSLTAESGSSLAATTKIIQEVEEVLKKNKEVIRTVVTVGGSEQNTGQIIVKLCPKKERKISTADFKDLMREQLKPYSSLAPAVSDSSGMAMGGKNQPFNVNIIGENLEEIQKYSSLLVEKIKNHPALRDVDSSYRQGKPEFQIVIDKQKAELLGVSSDTAGYELRTLIEGTRSSIYKENDKQYYIRVRLKEDQRNLKENFNSTFVPNINNTLIPLSKVSEGISAESATNITRQDRSRYIGISAGLDPNGPGMGTAIDEVNRIFKNEIKLPPTVRYTFEGQAKELKNLFKDIIIVCLLAILIIFFILASLYESFITPITIMLVFPLAICGALLALFATNQSLDLFSMIGCMMLLGLSTKNSILLVDYANRLISDGMARNEAIIEAGKVRLRPILMTTFALIVGMAPVAIGLSEISAQRQSMGVAVIGGLISSTLLTLVVIPASFSYIDRFRIWSGKLLKNTFKV